MKLCKRIIITVSIFDPCWSIDRPQEFWRHPDPEQTSQVVPRCNPSSLFLPPGCGAGCFWIAEGLLSAKRKLTIILFWKKQRYLSTSPKLTALVSVFVKQDSHLLWLNRQDNSGCPDFRLLIKLTAPSFTCVLVLLDLDDSDSSSVFRAPGVKERKGVGEGARREEGGGGGGG